MKELKVGIIGVGKIAKIFHLPSWHEQSKCKVVAISDADKEQLEKVSKKWSIDNCFNSYKELLKLKDIDIVTVATPNIYHAPQTIAALNSKKHVIVEKPFAVTLKDAEKMLAAAKRNRRLLMCAQHQRFRNVTIAARNIIKAKPLGDIYHVRALGIKRRVVPPQRSFIERKYSGGGPVFDLGAHLLDVAWWLMGCPAFRKVYGITQMRLGRLKNIKGACGEWSRDKFDIEDWGAGIYKFSGGKTLYLEVSYLLNQNEDNMSIQFCGTKGGLRWPALILTRNYKGKPRNEVIDPGPDNLASRRQISHFVECVRENKEPLVKPQESVEVVKMLEKLYKSNRTGEALI